MSMIDIAINGFYVLVMGISFVLVFVTFKYYKSWLRHSVEPLLQPLILISLSAIILLVITIIGIVTDNMNSFHIIQLIITGAIIALASITAVILDRWLKRMSIIKKKDTSMPSIILYLILLSQTFKGETGYLTSYYLGRSLSDYIQNSKRSIKSVTTLFSSLTGIVQIAPDDIREETVIITDSKYINDKTIADLITYFARGYWEGVLTKIRGKETRCLVRQNFTDNYFEIYLKPTKNNNEVNANNV